MSGQTHVRDPAAALTDPALTMPPVPAGGPQVGIRWLRRTVARFADGTAHDRRRRLVTDILDEVEPAGLRPLAEERTRRVLDDADGRPVDLAARVCRVVPVDVVAAAAGMPPVPADSVAAVATAYHPAGADGQEEPADEAVLDLVGLLGGTADEATAARIGLLVQTRDATAALVANAVPAALSAGRDRPADAAAAVVSVVAETLRRDPPVRATRRVVRGTGEVVPVDLAAGGLPFGAGPHRCPGRDHATAIAAGILDAVLGCRLVDPATLLVAR